MEPLVDYFIEQEREMKKNAIKSLFTRDSISFEDRSDGQYLIKIFLWTKTLICLVLNRVNGTYLDTGKEPVLAFDGDSFHGQEGTIYEWSAVWTSPYFLKDWNVAMFRDST